MKLRRVTYGDAEQLLVWRNDPLTRANSRTTGEITSAMHRAWLGVRLADPHEQLFIAEDDGSAVGTGRISDDTSSSEISLTVAPERRGKGYARQIITALLTRVRSGAVVRAQVLVTNRPSLIAFLHNGFIPTTIVQDDRRWLWLERRV